MSSKSKTKKAVPTATGFISFSSVLDTSTTSSFSALSVQDTNDSAVPTRASNVAIPSPVYTGEDVELSSIFKKLLKRDAGTRKKALGDMQAVIADRGNNIVYGAISHFVYCFSKLVLDNDKVVREQVLKTLGQLISVDIKALGSYRKNIFGMLWVSKLDPCQQVAQAASLVVDFLAPTEKRETVIKNMLSSIIEQLRLILSSNDYKSLSDMTVCIQEEAEERFDRLVGSALRSLINLLVEFRSLNTAECPATNQISSPSEAPGLSGESPIPSEVMRLFDSVIWQKLTSSRAIIRKASYELVQYIAEHWPLLVHQTDSITSQVLASLNESDLGNVDSMLHAVVLFARARPDCWLGENSVKALANSLCRLMNLAPEGVVHFMLPLVATISADQLSIAAFSGCSMNSAGYHRLVSNLKSLDLLLETVIQLSENVSVVRIEALVSVLECAAFVLLRRSVSQLTHVEEPATRLVEKYSSLLTMKIVNCLTSLCLSAKSSQGRTNSPPMQWIDSAGRVLSQLHRATNLQLISSWSEWRIQLWLPLSEAIVSILSRLISSACSTDLFGEDSVPDVCELCLNDLIVSESSILSLARNLSQLVVATQRHLYAYTSSSSNTTCVTDTSVSSANQPIGVGVVLDSILQMCGHGILNEIDVSTSSSTFDINLASKLLWCQFAAEFYKVEILDWMELLSISNKNVLIGFTGPWIQPLIQLVTLYDAQTDRKVASTSVNSFDAFLISGLKAHLRNIALVGEKFPAYLLGAVFDLVRATKNIKSLVGFVMLAEFGFLPNLNRADLDSGVSQWLHDVLQLLIEGPASGQLSVSGEIIESVQMSREAVQVMFVAACSSLTEVACCSDILNRLDRVWRSLNTSLSCYSMLTIWKQHASWFESRRSKTITMTIIEMITTVFVVDRPFWFDYATHNYDIICSWADITNYLLPKFSTEARALLFEEIGTALSIARVESASTAHSSEKKIAVNENLVLRANITVQNWAALMIKLLSFLSEKRFDTIDVEYFFVKCCFQTGKDIIDFDHLCLLLGSSKLGADAVDDAKSLRAILFFVESVVITEGTAEILWKTMISKPNEYFGFCRVVRLLQHTQARVEERRLNENDIILEFRDPNVFKCSRSAIFFRIYKDALGFIQYCSDLRKKQRFVSFILNEKVCGTCMSVADSSVAIDIIRVSLGLDISVLSDSRTSECSSSMEYCDPSQPANKGTEVWCIRNGKDSPTVDALAGVIVGVHRDTPIEPYYYSVRLPLPDGNDFEIQTTSSRILLKKPLGGSDSLGPADHEIIPLQIDQSNQICESFECRDIIGIWLSSQTNILLDLRREHGRVDSTVETSVVDSGLFSSIVSAYGQFMSNVAATSYLPADSAIFRLRGLILGLLRSCIQEIKSVCWVQDLILTLRILRGLCSSSFGIGNGLWLTDIYSHLSEIMSFIGTHSHEEQFIPQVLILEIFSHVLRKFKSPQWRILAERLLGNILDTANFEYFCRQLAPESIAWLAFIDCVSAVWANPLLKPECIESATKSPLGEINGSTGNRRISSTDDLGVWEKTAFFKLLSVIVETDGFVHSAARRAMGFEPTQECVCSAVHAFLSSRDREWAVSLFAVSADNAEYMRDLGPRLASLLFKASNTSTSLGIEINQPDRSVLIIIGKILDVWYSAFGDLNESAILAAVSDEHRSGDVDDDDESIGISRDRNVLVAVLGEEFMQTIEHLPSSAFGLRGVRRPRKVSPSKAVSSMTAEAVDSTGSGQVAAFDDEDIVDNEVAGEGPALAGILVWLLCLQKIDMAASINWSVRAAAGSFLKKSGVFVAIANALIFAGSDLHRQKDLANAFQLLNPRDAMYVDSSAQISNSNAFQRLAAYALYRTVCCLPAMVRMWYNDDCSRVNKSILTRFVEEKVKLSLLRREIALIQTAKVSGRWALDELTVSGSVASGEISARYSREDASVEIIIRLPPSYPLKNVEVDCTTKMGISEGRWRKWVLQIVQMLAQQDGNVVDAVLLWKANIEKEFEGVEPCPICYSIMHPKSMCLPTLECATCHNKFHNQCLYTWFKSSGKSKCVICQQPFFQS